MTLTIAVFLVGGAYYAFIGEFAFAVIVWVCCFGVLLIRREKLSGQFRAVKNFFAAPEAHRNYYFKSMLATVFWTVIVISLLSIALVSPPVIEWLIFSLLAAYVIYKKSDTWQVLGFNIATAKDKMILGAIVSAIMFAVFVLLR